MGDRVYLQLQIHGALDSLQKFDAVVDALEVDFGYSIEDAEKALLEWPEGDAPEFVEEECNYAQIDAAENYLQSAGVPYSVSHEEGGGFGAGCWAWAPDVGQVEFGRIGQEGASIPVSTLKPFLEKSYGDLREEIGEIVRKGELAEGVGMPPFSIPVEIREIVATRKRGDAK